MACLYRVDELQRRLTYLKHRERTYVTLLQDALRKEKIYMESAGKSDELDAALETLYGPDSPHSPRDTEAHDGDKRRSKGVGEANQRETSDHPFPGVPFHPEWESLTALKGAKVRRCFGDGLDDYLDSDDDLI